jgi:HEAT repeats
MQRMMFLVAVLLAGTTAVGQEAGQKDLKQPIKEASAEKVAPGKGQPAIDVTGAGETALELARTTKDSDAKWMAIRILGNLRYERAIPLLLASLSDPHEYVRSNAARALGDMRVAAAAKPLTELLKKETNGGVIQQTSLALGLLRYSDAVPALKAAAKHEDVQTRMWVLQAIGGLGAKGDVAFLARFLLDDPSSSVQTSAAQAIEQITGTDFGFPNRSGPSSPDEGLKQARSWWEKHKNEFKE